MQFLWRTIIAVLAVLLTFALVGPVSHLIGFPVGGDLLSVLKLCVAGIAAFYIIKGPPVA